MDVKKIITLLVALVLIPSASAELIFSPSKLDFDITGGENKTFDINAMWTGDGKVTTISSVNITEGLEVDINRLLTFEPNEKKTIPITFSAAPNIAPDNYSFHINFETFVEKEVETVTEKEYIRLPGGVITRNITQNVTVFKPVNRTVYRNRTVYKNRTVTQKVTDWSLIPWITGVILIVGIGAGIGAERYWKRQEVEDEGSTEPSNRTGSGNGNNSGA